LSIRNIPRKETEATLRALIIKEVKKYYRKNPEDLDKEKWGKHGPVRNLKIILDSAGESRGFGFVELASHGAALHVLRRLNNNPEIYGSNHRLMVNFSIENVNAIQKLQQIRQQRRLAQRLGAHQQQSEPSQVEAEAEAIAASNKEESERQRGRGFGSSRGEGGRGRGRGGRGGGGRGRGTGGSMGRGRSAGRGRGPTQNRKRSREE
jgi:hypothetical protein